MKYSFIVPVYNRPDEINELLQSMCKLHGPEFEIIIVEDGSTVPCEQIIKNYRERLPLRYYQKPNSGPGQSRNYGVARANGDYVLILDSDIVLPPNYLQALDTHVNAYHPDAFGGPDRAHKDFNNIQKAINYAMTSFFTTGGIRGGNKKMDKFYPRSFNMGVRRDVYSNLRGFSAMRFGEDIDFSTRLFDKKYKVQLVPEAWVWHKRRSNFKQFFKQVHNSGIARIHLTLRHPGTLKLVHLLPSLFTIGTILCILLSPFIWWTSLPILAYIIIILIDSTTKNNSIKVGILSVPAAFVQLIGYGTGFILAAWRRYILHSGEFSSFSQTFYK